MVAVFAIGLLASSVTSADTVDCAEPVSAGQGLIRGLDDPDLAACVWKGIAFAAPPVGQLRWRAPIPPEPHDGVFDAYEYGAACPQDQSLTSGGEAAAFGEDCLYLNIWSPKKSGQFPVMYWIHGGAFRQGSGTYEMSDGARLSAERDVVVVTVDYRLGALGFLALPELRDEDPNDSVGNYGLMDQIRGLEWVRDNIAGFGGDPENVTIFGQSAGGMSVCALMAAPPAAGLFHKAINMSGACDSGSSLEDEYERGGLLADRLGCTGPGRLECLRGKTPEQILPDSHNMVLEAIRGSAVRHSPNIDGYVLVDQPLELIKRGDYNKTPAMLGHTRDEIKLYTMVMPGISLLPKFVFKKLLKRLMGPAFEEIMALYSWKDYKHPSQCALTIANDAFISRGYMAAQALADQGPPVYLWRFDWDDTRFRAKMGAFHGLDEPFVFGALEMDSRLAKLLANEKAKELGAPLSEAIMSYYTNFARTGDPNGPGLLEWPEYTVDNKERIYFDNRITVAPLTGKEVERYEAFSGFSMEDIESR
jgi:para-nitrobenzyl esterase